MKHDLSKLSTVQLRMIAREYHSKGELNTSPDIVNVGRWIAFAKKNQLVRALEHIDFSGYEPPGPQPGDAPQPDKGTGQPLEADGEPIPGEADGELVEIPEPQPDKAEQMGKAIIQTIEQFLQPDQQPGESDGGGKPDNGKLRHYKYELLLKLVELRLPVWLTGPTGSGKSHAVSDIAKDLGLEYYPYSCNEEMSSFHVFGYIDANGKYQKGILRLPYELGGVSCWDEIDAGNATVLTGLNMATANGQCTFPDATIEKHANFIPVACGNTWGIGATAEYVGRNPIDAATVNRFVRVEWPYDEILEAKIIGAPTKGLKRLKKPVIKAPDSPETIPAIWMGRIKALRTAVSKVGAQIIISPRASIYGVAMLKAGIQQADTEDMLIWPGVDKATRDKVIELAKPPEPQKEVKVLQPGEPGTAYSVCSHCGFRHSNPSPKPSRGSNPHHCGNSQKPGLLPHCYGCSKRHENPIEEGKGVCRR